MVQRIPGILTIREVAARFGLAESTMRSWRFRGHGPASFKIGATVVYRVEDVEAWERGNQEDTA